MSENFSDFNPSFTECHYSASYIKELEKKVAYLKEENRHLKSYSNLVSEVDRLKLELKHETSLREKYEQKYNNAYAKLIYLENEDSLVYEENEQISTLNQKVDMLVKANEQLQNEISKYYQKLQKATQEKEHYEQELIPKLKNELETLKHSQCNKEQSLEREKNTLVNNAIKERDHYKSEVCKLQKQLETLSKEEPKDYMQIKQKLKSLQAEKKAFTKQVVNRPKRMKSPDFPKVSSEETLEEVPQETSEDLKIQNELRDSLQLKNPLQTFTPPKNAPKKVPRTILTPKRRPSPSSLRNSQKTFYYPSFLRNKKVVKRLKKGEKPV